MTNLPNEILHNIFIRIPLEDRIECTLVCRYWYNSLSKRSLLHDVEIKSHEMFDEFLDMIQLFPDRGSQIESLDLIISRTFDKRKLCPMFPNLRTFRFSDESYTDLDRKHLTNSSELINFNSKLESITEEGGECEMTRQLIKANSCTHLSSLKLRLTWIENPRNEVFVYLKNIPALKELYLGNFNIEIEDLEIIHKNTPTLETLDMDDILFLQAVLPRDIIPPVSLTAFSISIDFGTDPDYPHWYKYMAKKYVNLTKFICHDQHMHEADPSQVIQIYQEGLLPLYENNGGRLNYFTASNMPTEFNIFRKLDNMGLRIQHFYLDNNDEKPTFDLLAQADQSKYAETIKIRNSLIASPIMLQNFTSLKEISIDEDGYDSLKWNVNLTAFLNAFPATLTSFSGHFRHVTINELPSHPINVEKFNLSCFAISPTLALVISNYFPKLKDLNLRGLVTENISINLLNSHYDRIRIVGLFDEENSLAYSVIEGDRSEPLYYIRVPFHDSFFYLNVSPYIVLDYTIINVKYTKADISCLCIHRDTGWELDD